MTTTKLDNVFEATWDWLQIVEKQGCEIDWDAEPIHADEWNEACAAAGVDSEDYEVGFGVLVEPRACDTLLRAGDIVCTQGYGGDVVFLRRAH